VSLNRYAKQRDANEPEIVHALKRAGYSVARMDLVDLVVGKHGRCHVVEVKLPRGPRGGTAHSRLNARQRLFKRRWKGCYHEVRTPEGALRSLGECRGWTEPARDEDDG